MSLFDFFTGSSDTDIGKQVLGAYFAEASKFPEFGFDNFDAWLTHLQSKVSDILELVGGLVKSNSASTTVGQAMNRATDLANQSGGQASIPEIVQAAGGKGDTVNWIQAVPDVAGETVQTLATGVSEGLQSVGEGALSTLKVGQMLTKYLPLTLALGAGVYLYVQYRAIKR